MRLNKLLSFLFILVTTMVFSQEKISHIVVKGESVYSIAKQYQVKPSEIFELNPNAKKVLKLNMVLKIPNHNFKPEETVSSNTPIIHEVLAKETLYGISKKYKVSIDKITEANPIIQTEGLKLGTKITIPISNSVLVSNAKTPKFEVKTEVKQEVKSEIKPQEKNVVENQNNDTEIIHQVLPKETKYGLSKKYKISIAELERLNPSIVNELPVGYQLIIKKGITTKIETTPIQTPVAQIEEEEEEEVPTVTASGSSQIKVIEVKKSEEEPIAEVAPLSAENMSKADFMIAKASENIGVRYRSGGTNKSGFDCSGLMITTFKEIDMTLPRTSNGQSGFGTKIDRTQAQKGDLIFFTTNGRGNINHVGMVVDVLEDEIKFIHASVQSGVIISSTKETYYAKRFVQVNRVLN